MKKNIVILGALLAVSSISMAQTDLYIGPATNMVTFPNSNITVFGNLINDGVATEASLTSGGPTGLNHNGGGNFYLFRSANQGTGSSEVKDGPQAPTPNGEYNEGGACVRVYNMITDNTVGVNVPGGASVSTATGSGQVNIRQEVRVSNALTMTNGIIWTPRNKWNHAYIHLENNTATITGAASPNSAFTAPNTNIHIDGYIARTGSGNISFPVGDGVYSRFCSLSNADTATYRAAYYKVDPKTLTPQSGLSGSATQGPMDTLADTLADVTNREFWDIDGNGTAKVTLDALNTVSGYSDWANDPAIVNESGVTNLCVVGLDDWEYFGKSVPTQISLVYDGPIETQLVLNPDLGGVSSLQTQLPSGSGNPFVAFTWGVTSGISPFGLDLLDFSAKTVNCTPVLEWTIAQSVENSVVQIQRSSDQTTWKSIISLPIENISVEKKFTWMDSEAPKNENYYYRLRFRDLDENIKFSDPQYVALQCESSDPWSIFPNPTRDVVNILGTVNSQNVIIAVYDSYGRLVKTKNVETTNNFLSTKIDLSGIAQGSYSIRVANSSTGEIEKEQLIVIN